MDAGRVTGSAEPDDWSGDRVERWLRQAAGLERQLAPVSELLFAAARLRPGESVLDVGCGTGLVGQELRARGFTGRLLGLDISQASLDLARQGGTYDSLRAADLQQRLYLDDDSVDAVVCVGVMTYLPEVEAVWREFARVVRPGGVLVTTQRDDLWDARNCQSVVDRLTAERTWTPLEIAGPAPYLPDGYGGTPEVDCYYLTARVGGAEPTAED